MFALILTLLRGIKDISVLVYDPVSILIVVILLGISALIGMFKYRRIYKDKREVYYTETMIHNYINRGRSTFRKEVNTTIYIFAIFVILMVLFLIYGWLEWLFFALLCFGFLVYVICGLPPDRLRLYK